MKVNFKMYNELEESAASDILQLLGEELPEGFTFDRFFRAIVDAGTGSSSGKKEVNTLLDKVIAFLLKQPSNRKSLIQKLE